MFTLELDVSGNILTWGFCLEDCPYEPPSPSCLNPPPVPTFGTQNSNEINFNSTWFTVETQAIPYYQVVANRTRYHRPGVLYDVNNTTESVKVGMNNSYRDFRAIYGIMPEGAIANYTCPLGYVFNNSFNIFFEAFCSNWTWIATFNNASRCVRKFIKF